MRAKWVMAMVAAVWAFAAVAGAQVRDPREAWLARTIMGARTMPHRAEAVARACGGPLPAGVTCERWPISQYPCVLESGERASCAAYGLTYVFDPPMPARPVVRALGFRHPQIVSTDVHMRSWSITDRDRARALLGVWSVTPSVERPFGRRMEGRAGPSPIFAVDDRTTVTRLSLGLDFSTAHQGVPPRWVPQPRSIQPG
jgi:hypothetical protein